MSVGPIIVLEQFFNEVQAPLIVISSKKALDEGKSVQTLFKPLYESYLPEGARLIAEFEAQEPSLVNFLSVKRKLLDFKKWVDGVKEGCSKFYAGKSDEYASLFTEAETLLNDQLLLINAHIPAVYAFMRARLPADYTAPLEKAYRELEKIMEHQIATTQYSQEEGDWRKFHDLTKRQLALFANLALQQQDVRLQVLLQEGRSLYFTQFPNLQFSLLNTWTGSLYVVMDVLGQALGNGATKVVTRAVELQTGEIVALVKSQTLFHKTENEREKILLSHRSFVQSWRESEFLMQLKGTPGIISFSERIPFEREGIRYLFLVEKRYEDGSLQTYLKRVIEDKIKVADHEKRAIAIALQLLTGLCQLRNLWIIHRDIKPHNILCDWTDPAYPQAVLCDFNTACTMLETNLHKKLAFSDLYGAPEYVRVYIRLQELGEEALAAVCSFAIDIWAMGLVFYQLFFLEKLPWDSDSPTEEEIQKVRARVSSLQEGWIPKKFASHRFYPLISQMLRIDPKERITASQALEECQRLSGAKK